MRKPMIGLLSVLMACSVLALGCSKSNETAGKTSQTQSKSVKTIKIANFYGADHPVNNALREKFKTVVEQNSNQTLKIEIYENNKLGSEEKIYDGVRGGTIEMGVLGVIMESDVQKVGVIQLPFLFDSYKHARKVLDSPLGKELVSDFEPKIGVHFLGYDANGFRVVSSNKPIEKIEDFKGFRLRMPNIKRMISIGQALGANVTPMPISEVFSGLEQKVIDGQENPYATLRASGWFEVQKYVLDTRHVFSPNIYVMNKKFWDGLTPDQQKVVTDAMNQSTDYEWGLLQKSEQDDKKFLEQKGLKITIPDKKFKQDLIKATAPVYDEFYKNNPEAKGIVEKIRKEKD